MFDIGKSVQLKGFWVFFSTCSAYGRLYWSWLNPERAQRPREMECMVMNLSSCDPSPGNLWPSNVNHARQPFASQSYVLVSVSWEGTGRIDLPTRPGRHAP